MSSTYEEVCTLLSNREFKKAESWLIGHPIKDDKWHFLYSKVLMQKAWFDSAKSHLEKAIALNPSNEGYKKQLASFMARPGRYSDDYYNARRYRRRSGCCCCCCDDDCCHFSCLDLICLDSCCECMGGDLIECI
ncbi:molecular chaperone DnaJ [Niameybacter massiliensis]|uniref:Molecular chaperone DnaJ n=1 Tax=Holtiella tumoricola TaxID=3018743 RepID=A0AA42DJZ6_9FIRM|nr:MULTISPECIES: molecular chaperone DnaJ [Lachnospirales]MDA3730380.1 molecular chaperone DnaJ [Holtiella tumoricola]